MTKIIGIDDAGRGPVLGPMVLAGVLIESEKDQDTLKEWGARDSKALTPKRRDEIKQKIEKSYKNHIEITSPKEIDESDNLNYLEAIKAAMIINKLGKNIDGPAQALIDCPSTNIESWTQDVENLVENKKIKIICKHKADEIYPVVSAASIIAKEKREEELRRLKKELAIDFGSGYPADPKTKEFIQKYFEDETYKNLIRFSWATVKKLVKEKSQKTLF